MGAAVCPKCGSNDQVHTARELFDTMNGSREQALARLNRFPRPGQPQPQGQGQGQGQWGSPGQSQSQGSGQAQGSGANSDDGDYDHYNVEGSDSRLRRSSRRGEGLSDAAYDGVFDGIGDNLGDDIGGAVVGVAMMFAGRAIGKRVKKAFQEKVVPAMEARAAQAQQQLEQSKAEQDAIVARYPELRSCLKDQVVFLDGGYKTLAVSELKLPITLAQADDVVARLR